MQRIPEKAVFAFILAALSCVLFFGAAAPSFSQTSQTGVTGVTIPPEDEPSQTEAWDEDMDARIDKTIKVLEVVKSELKDIKTVSDTAAAPVAEKSWTESMREKLAAAIRIWNKVKKALASEEGASGAVPATAEEQTAWVKDVQKKLDTTMETIKVLKEELNKIDETDVPVKK